MNRPNKTTRLGVAGTALAGAVLAGTSGSAVASSSFDIGSVGSANPRAGVQNNVLTPARHQTSVAWGNLPLTNPDAANGVTHYGYNTLDGGPLTQDQERGAQDRARQERLPRPRRQALPLPGPRDRSARLRHADQPRRDRPRQAGHADLRHRHRRATRYPTIDGITWDPFTHQLLLTAESRRPRAACSASASTPTATPSTAQGHAPAGARLRRLRGRPERRRRQRLARRGHRRRRAPAAARCPTATSTASRPPTRAT